MKSPAGSKTVRTIVAFIALLAIALAVFTYFKVKSNAPAINRQQQEIR